MTKRGITLVEVLVTLVITMIIAVSISTAYGTALKNETKSEAAGQRIASETALEEKLRDLISCAYIDSDLTDTSTYFVAPTDSGSSIGGASVAPQIVFTIVGRRPSVAYLESTDTDFETLNQNYGPVGGATEVSLATDAVGDAAGKTGLFLRQQTPSDADNTQGGYETLLDSRVSTIGFEFWDGQEWTATWDTTAGTERRLPAAVRVHYTLSTDDSSAAEHVFTVALRNSDVTATTPLATAGTGVTG